MPPKKKRKGLFDGSVHRSKSTHNSSKGITKATNLRVEGHDSAPRRNRDFASLGCGGVGGRRLTPSIANCHHYRPNSDGLTLNAGFRDDIDGQTTKTNTTASGRRISAPSVFVSPSAQNHLPSSVDSRDNFTTEKRPAVEESSSHTSDVEILGLDEASRASGSRIMDLKLLSASMQKHTCCRRCAEWQRNQALTEFAIALDQSNPEAHAMDFLQSYKAKILEEKPKWKNVPLPSHSLVEETRAGVASVLKFECHGLTGGVFGIQVPRGRRHRHRFTLFTSPTVGSGKVRGSCSFASNMRLAFGMMASGSGPYRVRKQLGHLDIPVSEAWFRNGFQDCFHRIGSSIEARARISCETALADEVILTLEKKSLDATIPTATEAASDDNDNPAHLTGDASIGVVDTGGSEISVVHEGVEGSDGDSTQDEDETVRVVEEEHDELDSEEDEDEVNKENAAVIAAVQDVTSDNDETGSIPSSGDEDSDGLEKHVDSESVRFGNILLQRCRPVTRGMLLGVYGVTVSIDAGWLFRGSGNSYNSNSGTVTVAGNLTGSIVDFHCMTKRCATCEKKKRQIHNEGEKAVPKWTEAERESRIRDALSPHFKAKVKYT